MDREDKERSLHNKISMLQLQLLDFHKKISPMKREPGKGKEGVESNTSQDQAETESLQVESNRLQCSILRSLFCILCPFLFPTLIYSIEGYCPLFWQVTAVSSFITFFLLLMAFSFLSYKMQKVIRYFYKIFYGAHNKVKIVIQNADYLGSRRKYQYTSAALLLLVILAFSYWALQNNMPTLFNLCLVAGGFVCGMLSVNVYTFWKEPKQLPYLSPLISKRNETVNSPSPRELDFSEMLMERSPSLSPIKRFRMVPEKSLTCTEFPGMAPLPVSLLVPEHQKAVPRIQRQSPAH